jgi:hypothetical protein
LKKSELDKHKQVHTKKNEKDTIEDIIGRVFQKKADFGKFQNRLNI